ncbi:MAG: DUF2513 domain-containing protein [Caulobacteraceae bacterium]
MKRDMELVREVLLRVETLEGPPGSRWRVTPFDPDFQVPGFTGDQVGHHLRLLADEGFLLNAKTSNDGVMLEGLSWAGCEFLDAVRDDVAWRRTKEAAVKAGTFTLTVLAAAAKAVAAQAIKDHLGLDFSS